MSLCCLGDNYLKLLLKYYFDRDADISSAGLCLLVFVWSVIGQQRPWWMTTVNKHSDQAI